MGTAYHGRMASLARFAPLGVMGLAACFVSIDDYPVGNIDTTSSTSSGGGATSASSTGGTATGGGGMGGSGGMAPADGQLLDKCDANNFCEPPLSCWPESDENAGPAGGICTKACATDAECPNDGYCALVMPGFGTCTHRCTIGDADPNKCLGRRDLACSVVPDLDMEDVEICRPLCSDDTDCVTGRECDRRTGLCAVKASGNFGQMGAQCNPNFDLCRGRCSAGQTCQEECVFGAQASCVVPNVATRCILPIYLTYPLPNVGDRGLCARECTCDDDCNGTDLCNVEFQGTRYCAPLSYGTGLPCPMN